MGHNTLGVIPRSVKWRRVVDLLESDASNVTVTALTLEDERREARLSGEEESE